MAVLDIHMLKEKDDENCRCLKPMYAELSLKHEAFKDIVEKSFKAGSEARAGLIR